MYLHCACVGVHVHMDVFIDRSTHTVQFQFTASHNNYSTAQMQGITNARYERVYTRQRTRLREAANAFARGRERVSARRRTRSHTNANAFTRGVKRVHTRRQTRSHEAPEANAFARTRQRTHFRMVRGLGKNHLTGNSLYCAVKRF